MTPPSVVYAAAGSDIQHDDIRFRLLKQYAKVADPQPSAVHTGHLRHHVRERGRISSVVLDLGGDPRRHVPMLAQRSKCSTGIRDGFHGESIAYGDPRGRSSMHLASWTAPAF